MLNNPWLVGIGGSVISGIIVWFVTTKLLTRKVNKEYLRRIDQANNEILYSLRPSIAGGKYPKREIISAIISSSARKYELQEKDLMDMKEIGENIIKEVMDNSFLSPQQKNDLCNELLELKKTEPLIRVERSHLFYDNKKENYYTSVVTLSAALMTSMVTLISFSKFTIDRSEIDRFITLGAIPLAAILITFISAYSLTDYSSYKKIIGAISDILNPMTSKNKMKNSLSNKK